jgi:hypothetical protein
MIPLALLAAASCVLVEGDRILMSDLAKAVPEFAAVAGTEPIGLAPAPRIRRTFFWREIAQLGKAHGIEVPAGTAACFEGASEVLTEARVLEALLRTPHNPAATITVIEFSRYPLPHGELEFGPSPPADAGQPAIWRGRLNYGVNRSVTVWARVKLEAPPREVERGDTVAVEVASGAALLKFEAAAESGGKAGDMVLVRNPANGARFRARVVAKGKVEVDATQRVETSHVLRGASVGGGSEPGR